jgi:hypothetical protein
MKAKFSSGVIFSESVVKFLMIGEQHGHVLALVVTQLDVDDRRLADDRQESLGHEARSIEMLVSLRSVMVLRTASRIEAKLLASWPDLIAALRWRWPG